MEIGTKDSEVRRIFMLDEAHLLSSQYPDKRIVLVGGCFDIVHLGHLRFFQRAKEAGDVLVVALESDTFIRERKKRQPVHSQEERAEILAALRMVDGVLLLPLMTHDREYFDMVMRVKPAIIAITEGDPYKAQKEEQAALIGASVQEVFPLLPNFSTSKIVNYEIISSDRSAG